MKIFLILFCSFMLLVINADAQTKIKTLRLDDDNITSIHYLPDGKHLVSSSFSRNVVLWNTQTGKLVWNHDFDDRKNKSDYTISEILAMDLSPDGKLVAVAVSQSHVVNGKLKKGRSKNIVILDSKDGEILNTFENGVKPLVFSSDDSLAVRMVSGESVIWNYKTGESTQSINYERGTFPESFSPDGKFLAIGLGLPKAGTVSPDLVVWNIKEKKEVKSFLMKSRLAVFATFSPDGKMLVISGENPNQILFVNTQTWEIVHSLENEVVANKLAFSPNGKFIVAIESSFISGYVHLLDTSTYKKIKSFSFKDGLSAVSFSPNGMEFAVGTESGKIILYHM